MRGRIHPSAVISDEAELADDVEVGPYVVLEGRVRIGRGCVLKPMAHLVGPLTMGQGNQVFTGAVLGEAPQHLHYAGEPTSLEIGDCNTFREHVTVSRGTAASGKTRIGSHNYFMASSHVGHDCVVGDRCILANSALLGGHCEIGDRVFLSGNAAVHQFCRVGRLAMLGGCSVTTRDIPPFIMQQYIDNVVAVNVVGMRRAGMGTEEINAVRQAFRILFHEGLPFNAALDQIEPALGHISVVAEMIAFIRSTKRGISPMRGRLAA
jgi:UDP-N-acetylglucosamine acyltransferase